MYRTVAGDRWKTLKTSARKLARDARALQKASRAPAGPPGEAKATRAGDDPDGWREDDMT